MNPLHKYLHICHTWQYMHMKLWQIFTLQIQAICCIWKTLFRQLNKYVIFWSNWDIHNKVHKVFSSLYKFGDQIVNNKSFSETLFQSSVTLHQLAILYIKKWIKATKNC